MNEKSLIITPQEIEPDPDAEICLLVKSIKPTETPSSLFELVHIARVRGFGHFTVTNQNYVYHHESLEKIIGQIKTVSGATHFEFMTAEEWQTLLCGNTDLRQAKTLHQIEFMPVTITDIFFENGKFHTETVNFPQQS